MPNNGYLIGLRRCRITKSWSPRTTQSWGSKQASLCCLSDHLWPIPSLSVSQARDTYCFPQTSCEVAAVIPSRNRPPCCAAQYLFRWGLGSDRQELCFILPRGLVSLSKWGEGDASTLQSHPSSATKPSFLCEEATSPRPSDGRARVLGHRLCEHPLHR